MPPHPLSPTTSRPSRITVAALVFAVLALTPLAAPARAAPTQIGRVALVAAGGLSPDAIAAPRAAGPHDGRAAVTVRIAGGADRLRRAGFDARPLTTSVVELR